MPVPGDRANVFPTNEEMTVTVKSLDDIMSGRGEPVSEEATAPATTESALAAPEEAAGASRDDQGRFAAKQTEAAVAEPEVPAAAPAPTPQPSGHVPIQALDAERGKRREIEERYDREMRELRDQVARLSQPAPKPPEPAAPPPSVFEDPEAWASHREAEIKREFENRQNAMSKHMAVKDHGEEAVNAALQAAFQAQQSPEGQILDRQLSQSFHPFDDLVKWHKRQAAVSQVGDDPEAYFQRRLAEWQESQQTATTQPQPAPTPQPAPAPNLPTAFAKTPAGGPRGGAEYGGPRPLSEIMGGR